MRLFAFSLMSLAATSLWAGRSGDLRENIQSATSIVLGQVTESRSYYGSDGEIYTDVTLNVSSALKETGRKAGRLRTFTVKGGAVGDTKVIFTDVPTFDLDEAVVLFFDGDTPSEKYGIRGGWVPELNARATKVLDTIEQVLQEKDEPIVESERQRAHAFLTELATTAPPADAGCYVLIGPKWDNAVATYKFGTTIPATWNAALDSSARSWTQAGTTFAFRTDAASTNEFLFGAVSGATTLASTRIEYDSTNRIRRFTMTFSNAYSWTTTGEAGKFDVENVTTHELGHAFGLTHPSAAGCSEQTMWASAAAGEVKKRTLENGDKAGALALYPAATGTTPAPAPTPTPAPAPVVTTPVFTTAYIFPSIPKLGQSFTIWAVGSGFNTATAQVVINGPACPAGCILAPGYKATTILSATTTLNAPGAYTIAIRNGATGTPSATKPFTVQ